MLFCTYFILNFSHYCYGIQVKKCFKNFSVCAKSYEKVWLIFIKNQYF